MSDDLLTAHERAWLNTALQALLADQDLWMDFHLEGRVGRIDPRWFLRHAGHPLEMRAWTGGDEPTKVPAP
jgi:hypothetical protein